MIGVGPFPAYHIPLLFGRNVGNIRLNYEVKNMPYIDVNVTSELNYEQKTKVKDQLGKAIELIPDKEEASLMISITDKCSIYLGGKGLGDGAFVDMRMYGAADLKYKELFTEELFNVMKRVLGISKNDVYLNIFEMPNWGVKGKFI